MDVNLDGNTITNAYLSGIEGGGTINLADATVTLPPDSVTISNIDATGTPSATSYLRGDGTWSNPTSGGAPVTLTGDAVGSGTGTVPVTVEGLNGTSLAGLATGLLYNTTSTGVPSTATANQVAAGLTGATGAVNLAGGSVTLPNACVSMANIDATGSPSATTYLRGDGTWSAAAPPFGATIYVDNLNPNATDTRGSLSPYSPTIPFMTITGAMGASTAGDTIAVLRGTYTDRNIAVTGSACTTFIFYPAVVWSAVAAADDDSLMNVTASSGTTVSLTGFGNTFMMTNNTSSTFVTYGLHSVGSCYLVNNNINWSVVNNLSTAVTFSQVAVRLSGSAIFIGNVSAQSNSGDIYSTNYALDISGSSTGGINFYGNATFVYGSGSGGNGAAVFLSALAAANNNFYGTINGPINYNIVGGSASYDFNVYGDVIWTGTTAAIVSPIFPTNIYGKVKASSGLIISGGNASFPVTIYGASTDGSGTSAQTGLKIIGNVPITTANTTGTVTWNTRGEDENQINITTGTNATVAMTFPPANKDTANQTLLYSTGQAVTTLTQTGATLDVGAFPSSLTAGQTIIFKRSTATQHWIRVQ